jgi:1,4-alpha-glucan branching enzyme
MPERSPPVSTERAGDLAIVLHSHMPYVEGFGTYPFGEEWLFDAYLRSHLPVLDAAERLTMTVTPVLADQLEAPGVAGRLESFGSELRLAAAEAETAELDASCTPALDAHAHRYRGSLERLAALGGDLLAPFRQAQGEGRVELIPSSATHAVLPMLATAGMRRLHLDAGLRSHRRRFGPSEGFWLPECAYEPGLDGLLAEHGVRFFCVDQSATEGPLDALAPVRTPAGTLAFTIDWEAVSWLWSEDGYPSDPSYADSFHPSPRGMRVQAVGGGPYDPDAAEATARRQAGEFVVGVAERLREFRSERGREGLCVFAIDTELLGHWWWEGPVWLAEVVRIAAAAGIELVTLAQALERHPPEERPLQRSSWGEGKDLRTWDSPEVADMAWAARRLELRLLRALDTNGLPRASAERATRELLALQASDWAFLDRRGQAGDYPWQRSTAHAEALLDAIHSAGPADPRLRNLAPDLSLAPLLEP